MEGPRAPEVLEDKVRMPHLLPHKLTRALEFELHLVASIASQQLWAGAWAEKIHLRSRNRVMDLIEPNI